MASRKKPQSPPPEEEEAEEEEQEETAEEEEGEGHPLPPVAAKPAPPQARREAIAAVLGTRAKPLAASPPSKAAAVAAMNAPPAIPSSALSRRSSQPPAEVPAEAMEQYPFSVFNTVNDLLRIPVLIYLSKYSTQFAAAGFFPIIVGDEAINFHSSLEMHKHTRSPIEVLLSVPGAAEKEPDPELRNSVYLAFLRQLREGMANELNQYALNLPAPTRQRIETECACELGKRSAGPSRRATSIIEGDVDNRAFKLTIRYAITQGRTTDLEPLVVIQIYTGAVQGPEPTINRVVAFQQRLYGGVGYLLERAEQLKGSRDAAVAEKYRKEAKRLIKILDKRAFSCEAVTATCTKCIRDVRNAIPPSNSNDLIRMLVNTQYATPESGDALRNAHTDSYAAVAKTLIETGYYPPGYENELVGALQTNAISLADLKEAQDETVRDVTRAKQ